MELITPSYKIDEDFDGIKMLKKIERIARICYKSEDKITEKSYLRFCEMLMKRKHGAMIEHGGSISVTFIVNRGFTHEQVRHRLASYAQESTRYVNYGKTNDIKFVIPPFLNEDIPEMVITSDDLDSRDFSEISNVWMNAMLNAENSYNDLIELGCKPEEARGVLPIDVKTEIVVTANPREWRHIFTMRAAKFAHPSMRQLMFPLLEDFQKQIPIIFDDLGV